MRVRGLKHSSGRNANGNWIVAPHAGAWIETHNTSGASRWSGSHPMRVRGLKHRTTYLDGT